MGSGSSHNTKSGNLNTSSQFDPYLALPNHTQPIANYKSPSDNKMKLSSLNLNKNSNTSEIKTINNDTYDKSLSKRTVSVESHPDHITPVTSLVKTSNSNASVSNDGGEEKIQIKLKMIERDLAKSESDRLDLQDQIQMLEERCKFLEMKWPSNDDHTTESLQETLQLKDLQIFKLEKDLAESLENSKKLETKRKKQIRRLRKQMQEFRQEACIKNMEMNLDSSKDKREKMLKDDFSKASTKSEMMPGDFNSHSKVIVELSNQLTEQSEMISNLEMKIAEKDAQIRELKAHIQLVTSMKDLKMSDKNKTTPDQEQIKTNNIDLEPNPRVKTQKKTPKFSDGSQKNEANNLISCQHLDRTLSYLSESDSKFDLKNAASEKRIQSAISTTGTAKHELITKPLSASAATLSDHFGKMNKKTANHQRVSEKPVNPQLAFNEVNKEICGDSLLNSDVRRKKTAFCQQTIPTIEGKSL